MKISVYSSHRPDVCGEWEKEDVERELRELGVTGVDWVDWVLDHAFADEEGLPAGAVKELLAWSSSGRGAGSVVVTLPSDGSTVSVVMT